MKTRALKYGVNFSALFTVIFFIGNACVAHATDGGVTAPVITNAGHNLNPDGSVLNVWAVIDHSYSVTSAGAFIEVRTPGYYGTVIGTHTGADLNRWAAMNSVSIELNPEETRRFRGSGLVIYYGDTLGGSVYSSAGTVVTMAFQGNSESVLWNPGPKYHAGLTWTDINPYLTDKCSYWGTDFSQAHLVGNPSGPSSTGPYDCVEGTVWPADNGAGPSYYVDTRVGWWAHELNVYPGWSIWNLSGGGGVPIERQFLNNAAVVSDPCELREIGHVYQYWSLSPEASSFRPNADGTPIRLGHFKNVVGKYTAKVPSAPTYPRCSALPTAYVTSDFRVEYRDADNNLVSWALVGVLSYGQSYTNSNGSPSNGAVVFWESIGPPRQILLHGNVLSSLGVPGVSSIPQLTSQYQTVAIDFKKLVAAVSPPPPGFTVDDAIISGFDVYTSVRGADMTFIVKDIDIVGQW